jgi:hypothetical protein
MLTASSPTVGLFACMLWCMGLSCSVGAVLNTCTKQRGKAGSVSEQASKQTSKQAANMAQKIESGLSGQPAGSCAANTSQLQPSLAAVLLCYAEDAAANPAIPMHACTAAFYTCRCDYLCCCAELALRDRGICLGCCGLVGWCLQHDSLRWPACMEIMWSGEKVRTQGEISLAGLTQNKTCHQGNRRRRCALPCYVSLQHTICASRLTALPTWTCTSEICREDACSTPMLSKPHRCLHQCDHLLLPGRRLMMPGARAVSWSRGGSGCPLACLYVTLSGARPLAAWWYSS